MLATVTSCSCSKHWSSSIVDASSSSQVIEDVSESWLHVSPASSVLWFFLRPGDSCVGVLLELSDNFFEWEWTQSFNSKNSNVISVVFGSLCLKVIVYLSRAQNNFFNLVCSESLWVCITKYWLVFRTFSKIFNI